ncbi:MAG: hypothetical protein JRC92_00600 [Deltaproteobacteria bacterium]|nr:hypothetical protein [Deltaproteobacteria bacterium]
MGRPEKFGQAITEGHLQNEADGPIQLGQVGGRVVLKGGGLAKSIRGDRPPTTQAIKKD